jgi:hypothetical protein
VYWIYLAQLIGLMMEAAQTSENLVNSDQSAMRYNTDDSHLRVVGCYNMGFVKEKAITS